MRRLGFRETRDLLTPARRPRVTLQPSSRCGLRGRAGSSSGWVWSLLSLQKGEDGFMREWPSTAQEPHGPQNPRSHKSRPEVTRGSPFCVTRAKCAAPAVGMFPQGSGGSGNPGRPRGTLRETLTLPHAGTRPDATLRRQPMFWNSNFDLSLICSSIHSQIVTSSLFLSLPQPPCLRAFELHSSGRSPSYTSLSSVFYCSSSFRPFIQVSSKVTCFSKHTTESHETHNS